ncbi:hypothetical protein [Shewanella sp. TC10]|uniref:hypothetical protein n=1 Tax=Shewanella sp. TC10 TaxID=1419739 RepID=UPI00129D52DC|nr:hypothetical protein [Shewanella sp. TC10]
MSKYGIKILSFFSFALLILSQNVFAAEVSVSPGSNTLRTAVSSAVSGDVLILEDGIYTLSNDDLIVDKSLTIRAINAAATPRVYFAGGSNIPAIKIQGADTDFIMQGIFYYEGASVTNRPRLEIDGAISSVALLENQFSQIDFQVYETTDADGNKFVIDDLIIVGNSFSGLNSYFYQMGAKNSFIFAGNELNYVSLRLLAYGAEAHIIGNSFIHNSSMLTISSNSLVGSYSRVMSNSFSQTLSAESGVSVSNSNYSMMTLEGDGDFSNNIVVQGLNPYSATGTPGAFRMMQIGASTEGFWNVSNNVFDSKATALFDATPNYAEALHFSAEVKFINNIISDNIQPNVFNLDSSKSELYSVFSNNLCFNNVGDCSLDDNLIELDPKFIDEVDYVLDTGSPGINAGLDNAGYRDVDGSIIDLGVHGGPFSYLQFAKQRTENTVEPYFYPLFEANSSLSTSGALKVKAVAIARLR